jgi:hypothetical protein
MGALPAQAAVAAAAAGVRGTASAFRAAATPVFM